MPIDAAALEKPLPRPQQGLEEYASARSLEALLESILALEFLGQGYTRNAAGKAFQAWRALTGTLLALEEDKIARELSDERRRWLRERGLPRIPTSRLKALSQLLEEAGHRGFSAYTDKALNLHDYQYHGPDPDMALSKYHSREEAALDTVYLLGKLATIMEEHVKPRLEKTGKWSRKHEEALQALHEMLKKNRSKQPR